MISSSSSPSSTQLTRFNDDDHQHHHHLTTDQLGHHRMHKFCSKLHQIILSSRASTAPVMGSWVDSLCQMTVNATSTPLDSMTGAPSRYFEPQCQMWINILADHIRTNEHFPEMLKISGFPDDSVWQLQDYPSLGHINHVAKEHSVNLVWAVTGEHLNLYRRLTQMISTSVAGQISSDSSNVVELVLIFVFLLFTSFSQGEGDVPEDYNKHQDRRQLHILSLCSLYQRLQWKKDREEKVNFCIKISPKKRLDLSNQATMSAHPTWHSGHFHSACHSQVRPFFQWLVKLLTISMMDNLRECSSPGPHFIR